MNTVHWEGWVLGHHDCTVLIPWDEETVLCCIDIGVAPGLNCMCLNDMNKVLSLASGEGSDNRFKLACVI
jgi:hypothetical protein